MYHRGPAWIALRTNTEPWRDHHAPGYANGATARRIVQGMLADHGLTEAETTGNRYGLISSYVLPDHTHLRVIIAERRPPATFTPPTTAPCDPVACDPHAREPFTHTLGHDHIGSRISSALRLTGATDLADIHALWSTVDLSDLRNVGVTALGRLDHVMHHGRPPRIDKRAPKRSRPTHRHVEALRSILSSKPTDTHTERARALLNQLENTLAHIR